MNALTTGAMPSVAQSAARQPLATPFDKLLIANRGEIALRVMRSARALGLRTVAVYSSADRNAPHVRQADQAVAIGAALPAESYLCIAAILEAARVSGADAVHPGYGFLAENAAFAQACRDAGLVFIGPSAAAIAAMGDKAGAKRLLRAAGVACIAGYDGADQSDARLAHEADALGFPLMIKASAGGGGRGMRHVARAADFGAALASARSEAQAAFGSSDVILERAIDGARHIEVQVFADRHGRALQLGERDCSVQRRHQKLIEEAPSPAVGPELRERLVAAALMVLRTVDCEGAGTVEFLLDRQGRHFFIEMNTRLQVEHAVTEALTGLDLVEWQLRVARGEALPPQGDIRFNGHAIEVRLCAENPADGFMPQSGRIARWQAPAQLRVDHALHSGIEVAPFYDSMLAKLVAHGRDRDEARRKLIAALHDTVALGVATNQALLARALAHPAFAAGAADTGFIAAHLESLLAVDTVQREQAIARAALLLATMDDADIADPDEGGDSDGADGSRSGGIDYRDGSDDTDASDGLDRSARPLAHPLAHRLPLPLRLEVDGELVAAAFTRTGANHCSVVIGAQRHAFELVALQPGRLRLIADGVMETLYFVRERQQLLLQHRGLVLRVRDLSRAAAPRVNISGGDGGDGGALRASTNGRVVAVLVRAGEHVAGGQAIVTLEAMKMQHIHAAPRAGIVRAVHVTEGEQVAAGRIVAEIA